MSATPISTPTPDKVLARAADIIDQRGWHQGSVIGDDGSCCAVGALRLACGGKIEQYGHGLKDLDISSPPEGPMTDVFYASFDALTADVRSATHVGSIAEWNDHLASTPTEVTRRMRRLARRLRVRRWFGLA